MFVDARTLPAGTTIEASVCIAGAGAAGITLARAFARSGHKVAVLESGGLDFDEDTQRLYAGDIVGRSFNPLDVDRLRYFGGTTGHWSGGCRPFDPIDFEPGPDGGAPGSGWPFGRDTLEPYYRQAQEICQLGPYAWEPKDWIEDDAGPLPLGADARLRTSIFQYSPPTRFGQVYRADLERADAVTVYLHANVVDIETTGNAAEATAFRTACLDSPASFRVHAKYYVLALGGIENARLLLSSDRVQAGGVGNARDLVGRFFMDHAEVSGAASVVFEERAAGASLPFYDKRRIRGSSVQGFLHADPETRRREGLPPFGIGFEPGAPPNKEFAKKSLATLYYSFRSLKIPEHLGFHVAQIMRGVEWEAESVYRRVTGSSPAFYSTVYVCGAPPDPDSRVTLGDERDALGMRRVRLDWRLPADFERHMVRAHELLAEDLGRAGLGRVRVNSRETGSEPMAAVGNGSHHMGATRMHRDPAYGVVDENCRIHSMANLYVAGSSVFPSYGIDNPTMTIVALALRLADHLKPKLV
jgi:choline dehydrogenase-like flavoprotein